MGAIARKVIEQYQRHERTAITLIAITIGVIGGYGAILFRIVIHAAEKISFGTSEQLLGAMGQLAWWHRMLPPLIGLSIVAPLVHWLAREAKGHGVPEVMEAVALRGGVIRLRVVFIKLIASAITIGTGGSVGREGPIVQIGSAAGSVIGQGINASRRRMRIMVGCGAAAGLAATFNAPIAGVLFALEVLLGEYGTMTLSPIVISSVIATVVSRAHLGNSPAFLIPEMLKSFTWSSFYEIGTFLLLGLIAGALGVLFSKTVYKVEDTFDAVKLPVWFKGVIGGVLVGCLVAFFPNVAGVGYDTIEGLMRGDLASISAPGSALGLLTVGWMVALALFLAKLLATSLTLGAGGSGGIFAPSLFIGASAGYLVGVAFNALLPGLVSSPQAYALVGMGAMVAGVTHAPMTSIIILFEMTGDYRIILPLMLACIASTLLAQKLDRESIYSRKLARRGVRLREGREENVMAGIKVGEVMSGEFEVIAQAAPYAELVKTMTTSDQFYFPVVDSKGYMTGILSFHDLREHFFEEGLAQLVIADDLATRRVITLTPEDNLLTAFERFNQIDVERIPVVDASESRRVVGMISRRDLLNSYNVAVMRRSIGEESAS
ncbi:MAG TPA: chloride channel protein [Acidobacteriota bacterium]|nr:chloride channel protein [Acidobacteriota bacterium]